MQNTHPFSALGLSQPLLQALSTLGYEKPSPVQEQAIPVLLSGKDLIAQAQTGTGKTGAFALPILELIDIKLRAPQALILAPTRELAIQVAESFQSYATHLPGFHVLPIYGGQDYRSQLRALERGVHVIVGTPGRTMDHMRRGSLVFDELKIIVLDEADEMLKMGFVEDIEWVLAQLPTPRQTALFSATLPETIKQVAKKYIIDPVKVHIQAATRTVEAIEQVGMLVSENHKLEAVTRLLELEEFEAAIIFTRTKTGTAELSEKLEARGYASAALNGDMNQALREKVINRLKRGSLDIVVATDVAARGLDVERISLVINYDIPYDSESYIHRIGRTGRAGRTGKAVLLVSPRERRMLGLIENTIKQRITLIDPPSFKAVSEKRQANFVDTIHKVLAQCDLDNYQELIQKIAHDSEHTERDIAAALAYLLENKNKKTTDNEADLTVKNTGFREEKTGRNRRRRGEHERDGFAKRKRKDDERSFTKPKREDGERSFAKSTRGQEDKRSFSKKPKTEGRKILSPSKKQRD